MSQTYSVPVAGTDTVDTSTPKWNACLDALLTAFSGATAPASPVAYQYWIDTNAATKVLKQRNSANSAWIVRVPDIDLAGFEYVTVKVGTVSAAGATTSLLFCGGSAVTVSDVFVVTSSTTTSDATNFWQIQVDNVTDTLNLRAAAFSTNGADFTANTQRALVLDQNLSVAANKVLRITFTKNAAATTMNDVTVVLKVAP